MRTTNWSYHGATDVQDRCDLAVQLPAVEGLLRRDASRRRVHPLRRRPVHAPRLAQPEPVQVSRRSAVAHGPGPGQGALRAANQRDRGEREGLGWEALVDFASMVWRCAVLRALPASPGRDLPWDE